MNKAGYNTVYILKIPSCKKDKKKKEVRKKEERKECRGTERGTESSHSPCDPGQVAQML